MAFAMDGEFVLPAPREQVWQALNDPAVLCACIQGCQSMERDGENTLIAAVKMKVGPVSSVFNGKIELLDLDPPNSYRLEGKGEGGAAGFAKGGARVTLADTEGGTLLRYDVSAEIGGRLAQLGGRLINGVAKKQADQFFENFAKQFRIDGVSEQGATSAPAAHATTVVATPIAATPARSSKAPWAWFVALSVALLVGFLFGRSGVGEWSVVAMIALAVVSAGAGYRAGRD